MCGDLPHPPPIHIELTTLVRDERIELRTVRVRGENHAIAVIVERIEEDRDGVVTRELRTSAETRTHELVPLKNPGDHIIGRAISGQYADIERGVVEEDSDLGDLRRGLPFERLLLPESGGHRCVTPGRLVQQAVDTEGRCFAGRKAVRIDVRCRIRLCGHRHHGRCK